MRRLPLLALLLAGGADPQDVDAFLGTPEWHGFIRVTFASKGTLHHDKGNGDFEDWQWEESRDIYVEGVLDNRIGPGGRDRRRRMDWKSATNRKNPHQLIVRGEHRSTVIEESLGEAKSVIRDTFLREWASHAAGACDENLRLRVDLETGKYSFEVPINPRTQLKAHVSLAGSHRHEQPTTGIDEMGDADSSWSAPGPDRASLAAAAKVEEPLPQATTTLAGSRSIALKPAAHKGQGHVDMRIDVQWSFSPQPPERYELEMEAFAETGAYDTWRPLPGPDEQTPGTILIVRATLKGPRSANSDKPRRLRLALMDVSREKGLSINYPVNPGAPRADLRFLKSTQPRVTHFEGKAWTLDENASDVTTRVGCFDGGAWGEVVADCDLASGRIVAGHVKGDPAKSALLLPKRTPGSRIAAAWRSPGPDDQDQDGQPVGDPSVKGDGLTNYEEYRGFHAMGDWKEGDPNRKDFFVRDETGTMAEPGIALFERITNLRVHRLAADEFPQSRVINENRTAGANKTDQHGIRIMHDPTQNGFAVAEGSPDPGSPKDTTRVRLATWVNDMREGRSPDGSTAPVSFLPSAVAHELLHCCNVWHHGETDDNKSLYEWFSTPSGGIREGPDPITVVDEKGTDVTHFLSPRIPLAQGGKLNMVLHRKLGKSSGDQACVMRYGNAHGSTGHAAPPLRVMFYSREVIGVGLCTASDGNPPNTRFGPAAPGRGNCAGQIHVNDGVPAKKR